MQARFRDLRSAAERNPMNAVADLHAHLAEITSTPSGSAPLKE